MTNRRWIISANETVNMMRRTSSAQTTASGDLVAGLVAIRRPVHLHGETGTGKSFTARRIHEASGRGHLKFLEFHCQAGSRLDPADSLAGLLLDGRRMGIGTMHVEAIESLTIPSQMGLLDAFLALDRIPPGSCPRLVVSGAKPLWDAVEAGRFLPELYARIGQIQVHLPPLRSRPGRIEELANAFLAELTQGRADAPVGISEEAVDALEVFPWPGNLRQLRNAVEHALIFADAGEIRLRDLPAGIARLAGAPRRFREASQN